MSYSLRSFALYVPQDEGVAEVVGIVGVLSASGSTTLLAVLGAPAACGRALTPQPFDLTLPADPASLADGQGTPGAEAELTILSKPLLCGRGMTGSPPLGFGFTVEPADPDPVPEPEPEPEPEGFFAWYGIILSHASLDGILQTSPVILITPSPLPDGTTLVDYGATGLWVQGGIVSVAILDAFIATAPVPVHNRFDYI